MITFSDLYLGWHRTWLERSGFARRAHHNAVPAISLSEAERPFSYIRFNVVWRKERPPRPVHRHSVSVIATCCSTVGMCRISSFGCGALQPGYSDLPQGSHVLGPEHDPD